MPIDILKVYDPEEFEKLVSRYCQGRSINLSKVESAVIKALYQRVLDKTSTLSRAQREVVRMEYGMRGSINKQEDGNDNGNKDKELSVPCHDGHSASCGCEYPPRQE